MNRTDETYDAEKNQTSLCHIPRQVLQSGYQPHGTGTIIVSSLKDLTSEAMAEPQQQFVSADGFWTKHGTCLKSDNIQGASMLWNVSLLALGFWMVARVPVLSLFLNSSKVWLSRLRRSLLTPRIDHHVVLVLPKSIKTCRPFLWQPGNLNKTFLKFGLFDWDCLRWSSWKNAEITLWSLQESACYK